MANDVKAGVGVGIPELVNLDSAFLGRSARRVARFGDPRLR
jgi:hypothetical protein